LLAESQKNSYLDVDEEERRFAAMVDFEDNHIHHFLLPLFEKGEDVTDRNHEVDTNEDDTYDQSLKGYMIYEFEILHNNHIGTESIVE
jgi:hypothetical protein